MEPSKNLGYCGREVHRHDRARFLLSLFVPAGQREGLLALYALNIELAQVHNAVSEEMIGHIRYAWWQDALNALYAGKPSRGHPVVEALWPVIEAGHMPQATLDVLLDEYRTHFPSMPPGLDAIMEKVSLTYLQLACPDAEAAWRKAHAIIGRHRRRYGKHLNSWLSVKLLVAGM